MRYRGGLRRRRPAPRDGQHLTYPDEIDVAQTVRLRQRSEAHPVAGGDAGQGLTAGHDVRARRRSGAGDGRGRRPTWHAQPLPHVDEVRVADAIDLSQSRLGDHQADRDIAQRVTTLYYIDPILKVRGSGRGKHRGQGQ